MSELPDSVHRLVQRFARRLAIGLFLEVWPKWAAASLLASGLAVLAGRLFFPGAAAQVHWLWLAPFVAACPALLVCVRRAYRDEEVVALADSLAGGEGLLLALSERTDSGWRDSPVVERLSRLVLPRLRPWRSLAPIAPAAAFLAVALWLPQRTPPPAHTMLSDEIAAGLTATLDELKQQALVTPEEEQQLAEEIERIQKDAERRMDAASWEASDALRERVVSALSEKQDALKWAEDSLNRYAAAAQAGSGGETSLEAQSAEVKQALEKLAKSGLLAGAPADLQRLLGSGKLPVDPRTLAELSAAVSKYLAETQGRFGKLAGLGKEFGRFDAAEFPLESGTSGLDGDGEPGRGGISRGRGDAPLTWGDESLPADRFKAQALPPGAPRSPDDWAPIVELPGAPDEAPVSSARAAAREYAGAVGQAAWRRTLAPRHQSAVKKYFAK